MLIKYHQMGDRTASQMAHIAGVANSCRVGSAHHQLSLVDTDNFDIISDIEYRVGMDMSRDILINYNLPEEYVAAMREALLDANRPLAIRLAKEAIQRYPEHEEIQRFDYVLNPPPARVVPSNPEERQSVIADQEWIKQHREQYRNRWIALRSGSLVADAATLDELLAIIGENNLKGVLLTAIY